MHVPLQIYMGQHDCSLTLYLSCVLALQPPYEELEPMLSKPTFVIDLGFTDDDTMSVKQRRSLIRQLSQLYGYQRRCEVCVLSCVS
jgi:Trm5-related predicted tRNA methylase